MVANTYAANFGDIVKHGVLCEVLVRERPMRYIESHGGTLDYDLARVEPGPGGVWDFLELTSDRDDLRNSEYARQIRRNAGTRDHPGRYLGSIALAAALLPPEAHVVAFELVPSSARELAEGLAVLGRAATVEVADGLTGVCAVARAGDLVVLDPFDVHERGADFNSTETFVELATREVSTILWYPIYEPSDSGAWITDAVPSTVPRGWSARIVGDTAEGGLAGCGFLTAHLSSESEAAANAIIALIADTLSAVRPGLRME